MCGIAGIVAQESARVNVERAVRAMVRSLEHRGPDGQGQVVRRVGEWKVGLGHTRLAILDLSDAGLQPMASREKPCWLVFNGEIYNFSCLRKELELGGAQFTSRTDSEVLLRGYEAWGAGALERLRGMFALGLWDEAARRLLLARDPFGIKPLYYFQTENLFLFASEVRTLLATGLVPRRLCPRGLASYFGYGSVQAPLTIVEGVRSLLPGHQMTVDLREGRLRITEVPCAEEWMPKNSGRFASDRCEAVTSLRGILKESVRLHLVSDVPLAVILSGGIDSSVLVALISEFGGQRPKTFTVVFGEKEYSEASYARLVAERFETEHMEIPLSESQLLGLLPDALRAMDEPTIDGVNSFVISLAVKQAGVTVAVSGLGGDELFAGYPSFQRARAFRPWASLPRALRCAVSNLVGPFLGSSVDRRKVRELARSNLTPRDVYAISRALFLPAELQTLLRGSPRSEVVFDCAVPGDPVNAMSLYELKGYMASTLLRDTDAMSMAHALEVRVPFVDPVVVRYVLGLPGDWKVDRGRPKPLLLDAMKGVLPERIWRRPKMGFTLPFERWMRSALKPELDRVLRDGNRLARLGLDPRFARSVWEAYCHDPHKERWSRPWAFYVLDRWCELNHVQG